MKNYEEMAETVFRRIDEYKEKQRKRQKAIYTAASLTCACLVAAMGFAIWRASNTEPPVSLDNHETNQPESTPTDPVVLQNPTENTPNPTELTDGNAEPPAIGGSSSSCEIHHPSFHRIPAALIEYIGGQEVYDTWSGNVAYADDQDCPRAAKSIYTFIHDFNVPKAYFEDLYYSQLYSTVVCEIDLLYGDDYSSVDEFYRDKELHKATLSKRSNFNAIKIRIFTKNHNDFTDTFGDVSPISLSLEQIVNGLSIPREKLEEYASGMVGATYDMDFDPIYEQGTNIQIFSNTNSDPYPIRASDALICGINDYELE